ncbi:hypothetical protein ABB37_07890 [Leptomonas pyrrhocoris]|uniref:Uncharacterized protein n=1 Tax=Leptomonas pyrrhocoris TaxID=157538 RepID=A0A0M9FU37_LEPPY|nr:hypothetical protein ABB37_07890 [Leptomonas pyrrhocoris]KPA76120.1 hypothetical protein ABB37_07890 [Leptomonas pyrrhocoris]|eukprot:XP_015654559.1 hypothetical protein ABB37_07890 [Leptomonas pyrrhocoris]
MGQAASYAESSVQRALLKLKQEEQTEEDELLRLCGYRRPAVSTAVAAPPRRDGPPAREGDSGGSNAQSVGCNAHETLPPPPESLGPFVSLAPEYYSLDELRDALRYLPDSLWVSLYRVSLLYILDNDHDGRVKSTDISFFMDWGIKTVGRGVPPEQLAEVLQTYAALHCRHRCLQVGEEIEGEQRAAAAAAAAAAAQPPGRGGLGSGSGGGRTRRRPLQSAGIMGSGGGAGGGNGPSSSHHHHNPHHHQQAASVSSFMLLHLREAFFSSRPGGPAPLPSSAAVSSSAAVTPVRGAGTPLQEPPAACEGGLFSPITTQFASPRSAVTQPVTSSTRLEAAAHFAEWMLRLVQHQERDRRHERQRLERRLRFISAAEMKLCNSRLLHSQFLQHHSMRLRGGSQAMPPSLGDDDVVVVSQSSVPMPPGGATGGDVNEDVEPEVIAIVGQRLSYPDSDTVAGLPLNNASSTLAQEAAAGGLSTAAAAKKASSSSSRSVTPLGSSSALAKAQRDAMGGNGSSGDAAGSGCSMRPCPLPSDASPSHLTAAQNLFTSSSSRVLPSFPSPPTNSHSHHSSSHHNAAWPSESNTLMSSNPLKGNGAHTSADAGGGGGGAAERQTNSPNWCAPAGSGVASFSPFQLSAVLMDAEPLYVELERNGWCTIGAVEEIYLDFAVEDSYCFSFWAFCRLLNEASADEVQVALDLTTAQATAVLTSAAAVEEHRRAAAVRQLQRLRVSLPDESDGWARQVEVVPLLIVSEYTFVAFVTAFIHAYWSMLESMGVDAVTQPAEMASRTTAPPNTSPGLRAA